MNTAASDTKGNIGLTSTNVELFIITINIWAAPNVTQSEEAITLGAQSQPHISALVVSALVLTVSCLLIYKSDKMLLLLFALGIKAPMLEPLSFPNTDIL